MRRNKRHCWIIARDGKNGVILPACVTKKEAERLSLEAYSSFDACMMAIDNGQGAPKSQTLKTLLWQKTK
jgi:hypothetical protein